MTEQKKSSIKLYGFDDYEKSSISEVIKSIKVPESINNLAFIKLIDDTEAERTKLRRLINNNNVHFVIFSDSNKIARLAWDVNALCFSGLNTLTWKTSISNAFARLKYFSTSDESISFKSQNKLDVIKLKDINFILANGNYSDIHLDNSSKITVTKQLGQIEIALSRFDNLERFGKSVILNINKIRKVDANTILFSNNEKLNFPKYSKSFIYLKNKLIWK